MTRRFLVVTACLAILAYALYGAMVMNSWGLSAGSGLPLAETAAAMDAAGEWYSPRAGWIFAGVGVALGLGWAVWALTSRRARGAVTWLVWGVILVAGAPAYFVVSFGPFMNLGDTFDPWRAEAVWALELPLYAVSAAVLVGLMIESLATARRASVN